MTHIVFERSPRISKHMEKYNATAHTHIVGWVVCKHIITMLLFFSVFSAQNNNTCTLDCKITRNSIKAGIRETLQHCKNTELPSPLPPKICFDSFFFLCNSWHRSRFFIHWIPIHFELRPLAQSLKKNPSDNNNQQYDRKLIRNEKLLITYFPNPRPHSHSKSSWAFFFCLGCCKIPIRSHFDYLVSKSTYTRN